MKKKRIYYHSKSHYGCKHYVLKYDECLKFYESNMSERTRLCKCPIRNGGDVE